jgi:hypothetical protein
MSAAVDLARVEAQGTHIVLERGSQRCNDGRDEPPEVDLHLGDGAYPDPHKHDHDAQLGAPAEAGLVQNGFERARRRNNG